jgi:hypothetical protein
MKDTDIIKLTIMCVSAAMSGMKSMMHGVVNAIGGQKLVAVIKGIDIHLILEREQNAELARGF